MLVVSRERLQEMKPAWAFRIKGTSSAALDPAFMGLGPINACKQLILKSKLSVKDLDLIGATRRSPRSRSRFTARWGGAWTG